MKKSLIFIMLCIVAISCAFAGKSTLVVQGSPYSFQNASLAREDFKSTYGFGFKAGYRYSFENGLIVGADVKYSNFKYADVDNRYQVISFMAKVGGSHTFKEKWTVNIELGGGGQIRIIESCIATLGLNFYSGVAYAVSDTISVECGPDIGFAFQKNSADISVDVLLGAAIRL